MRISIKAVNVNDHTRDAHEPPIAVPPVLCWLVTGKCNLRCIHCQPSSAPDYDGPQMSFAEQMVAVPGLAASGVETILLTGGEPLVLRHRLFELIELIRAHDMRVWLNTNGILLDETVASRLTECEVDGVIVALDSGNPAIHDRFRARAGAHERALKAIRLLTRQGVTVHLNYVATKMTRVDVQKLQPLATGLGVKTIMVNRFRPFGRGYENLDALAVSEAEYREIVHELIDSCEGSETKISFEDPAVLAHLRSTADQDERVVWDGGYGIFGCQAGLVTLGLMPDGEVTPCAFLHVPIGNILTHDLKTIVEGSELLRRILDRDDRGGRCGTCEERWQCGGCRAHAFAESGDPLAEDRQCVFAPCGSLVGRPE